jgi:membrane protease YdiL (CAAX protease family)
MNETNAPTIKLQKAIHLLAAFAAYLLIDTMAIQLTDPLLGGRFAYSWLLLHHAIQIPLTLAIMLLPFWQRSLTKWGLNLDHWTDTKKILQRFTLGWILCTTAYIGISSFLAGWTSLLPFEPTPARLAQYLVFEGVIVGISEELVFRGLVFGMLRPFFSRPVHLFGQKLSWAAIISAAIFAIAHIGMEWFPMTLVYFDALQVFIAFCLGIFYAFIVERTGSLMGAILAHNISDLWLSLLYILVETIR